MKIQFTNEQLQYILNVLAERPYKEAAGVIQSIVLQTQTPQEVPQPEPEPEKEAA